MTTSFFISAKIFASEEFLISASLIFPLLSVARLLFVISNITKPFYITKPVTIINNSTVTKILKGII